MNYKNARKAAVLAFLAVSLFSVSGCGSDPEGKIEEKIKSAYPNSYEKVAYEVDKEDKVGYLEYKAKDKESVPFRHRVYFKLTDQNKEGFEIMDIRLLGVTVSADYSGIGAALDDIKAGKKINPQGSINEKILADYYESASKAKSYNFEDCVVFHQGLSRYLTKIAKNLKYEYDRSVTYNRIISSNSYYGNNDSYYSAENRYNSYNELVNEFKDYREQAPDVVLKNFGNDVYFENDRIGNYLRYYKIKGWSSGSPIIELVNEYPGRYGTGSGA